MRNISVQSKQDSLNGSETSRKAAEAGVELAMLSGDKVMEVYVADVVRLAHFIWPWRIFRHHKWRPVQGRRKGNKRFGEITFGAIGLKFR